MDINFSKMPLKAINMEYSLNFARKPLTIWGDLNLSQIYNKKNYL